MVVKVVVVVLMAWVLRKGVGMDERAGVRVLWRLRERVKVKQGAISGPENVADLSHWASLSPLCPNSLVPETGPSVGCGYYGFGYNL